VDTYKGNVEKKYWRVETIINVRNLVYFLKEGYLNRTCTFQQKKYTSFTKRLLDGLILLLFCFLGEWYVKETVEEWP
jgi:hypothetical protein